MSILENCDHYAPAAYDPLEAKAWAMYCDAIKDSIAKPDDWPGPNTKAEWLERARNAPRT